MSDHKSADFFQYTQDDLDVLSYGDLAIRRGLCKLYGHKAITKDQFARYKKRCSPYGSIASLYLWRLSLTICAAL